MSAAVDSDPSPSPSQPALASQHFVDAVLGTVIVGWQVQLILWGFAVSSLSAYVHTRAFANDPRWLKALLAVVMLAVTAQAGISFYSIWHYSTFQKRDEDTLYGQTVADCFATGPVAIVGALVQGYLIYRASSLFRNQLVKAAFITFMYSCVVLAFAGAMMYIACSFLLRAGKPFPSGLDFSLAVGTWLWASAFTDVMITASLTIVLRSRIMHFSKTTDSLLRRLIRLAIQTASYTAVLAVCGAALAFSFSSDSENSIYTNAAGSFYQPLSSCYAISLLVTLSSRNKLKASSDNTKLPVISTGQLNGFANTSDLITTTDSRRSCEGDVSGGGARGAVAEAGYLAPYGVQVQHHCPCCSRKPRRALSGSSGRASATGARPPTSVVGLSPRPSAHAHSRRRGSKIATSPESFEESDFDEDDEAGAVKEDKDADFDAGPSFQDALPASENAIPESDERSRDASGLHSAAQPDPSHHEAEGPALLAPSRQDF